MENNALTGVLIIAAGLFTITGAGMDWNWFMMNSRARLFVWLFGRNGARIFYILLGLFIAFGGLAMMVMGDSG